MAKRESPETVKAREGLNKFFNAMPDPMRVAPRPFNHGAACGVEISWAKKGIGFGSVTIAIDKKTQKVSLDLECMGMKFVGEVFQQWLDDWYDRELNEQTGYHEYKAKWSPYESAQKVEQLDKGLAKAPRNRKRKKAD